MSTSFEPSSSPMSRDPNQAERPATAYRTTAAVVCASCATSAGADYTFTTSGDVQCRRCADAQQHAQASHAASRSAGVDLAGERRCGCGGVASAGEMVNHVKRVDPIAHELGLDFRTLEMGSETVFVCCACGTSFALLNRLRRVRLGVRALQLFAVGLALGLIPFAAVRGVLGALALIAVTLLVFGVGSAPLWRDILVRRAHPPVG